MGERARHSGHQALFIVGEIARDYFALLVSFNLAARVAINLTEILHLRENLRQDFQLMVNRSLTQTRAPDCDRIATNCLEAFNHFRGDLIQPPYIVRRCLPPLTADAGLSEPILLPVTARQSSFGLAPSICY